MGIGFRGVNPAGFRRRAILRGDGHGPPDMGEASRNAHEFIVISESANSLIARNAVWNASWIVCSLTAIVYPCILAI